MRRPATEFEPQVPGESRTRARARSVVRCAALAATVIAVWPLAPYTCAATAMVAASPFVAIGSALAVRAVGWTALVASPVLVLTLVRRRWFCRWLCPTGLLCEHVGRIGSRAGRRAPALMPIGQWLALVTFAGAIFGYPALLWLDPLALLASFLGNRWGDPWAAASLASAGGLSAVLATSLLTPGLWCMRICPLGATQDLLTALVRLVRHRVGRLFQALATAWKGRPTATLREKGSAGEGGWHLTRRVALAGCLGAAGAWAVRRSLAGLPTPIRPPGALDEARLRGLCVRCGNCVRACPTKILYPDVGESGLSGLMCPAVRFGPGYCREDCCRCGDACASGAIARLLPAEKTTVPMGTAEVDGSVCLLSDNRECSICKNACPYGAIATVWSDEEYALVLKIDRDRCPGCGACQVACPTSPKAIVVRARKT